MKTKAKTDLTPSVVRTLTPAPVPAGGYTIGLDLGDRSHYVCVLDAQGQIVREGSLLNTPSLSCCIRTCVSTVEGVVVFKA